MCLFLRHVWSWILGRKKVFRSFTFSTAKCAGTAFVLSSFWIFLTTWRWPHIGNLHHVRLPYQLYFSVRYCDSLIKTTMAIFGFTNFRVRAIWKAKNYTITRICVWLYSVTMQWWCCFIELTMSYFWNRFGNSEPCVNGLWEMPCHVFLPLFSWKTADTGEL